MRIRLMDLVIAGATAATVAGLWLTVTPTPEPPAPASEEVPPYDPPRMADGHPDLNELWQALVTANWNLEDHEARAGLYPELIGAYGGEPAGQSVVPWTNVDPEEQMYEYACHDDNYDMVNLLIGARSREANGKTTDLD